MKQITGVVEKNIGRGAKMGFPTANIKMRVDQNIEEGIYIALTKIDKQEYKSLAFVGAAITFGETEKKLEIYILDFNHDIYGKKISVRLLEKIRNPQKFSSRDELVKQMKIDETMAQDFFKTYGRTE